MYRKRYSVECDIQIDECPECGGIWLDGAELSGVLAKPALPRQAPAHDDERPLDIVADHERRRELRVESAKDHVNVIGDILQGIVMFISRN